jgi:two-component system, chemotaxis family, chemotaxis protein CheY
MKVLIVDDYATMRRILRNLLNQLKITDIDDVGDGNAALAKISQNKYDLIISDWNMEPMTGLELLRGIRGNPESKDLKFIMVTAESKTENVVAAKNAGVDNYIVKPFNADTLKTKIEKTLGVSL